MMKEMEISKIVASNLCIGCGLCTVDSNVGGNSVLAMTVSFP